MKSPNPQVSAACALALLATLSSVVFTQPAAQLTIDELLELKRVGSPVISPDGARVLYTLRETNWEDNEYETEIWVGTATGTRPLTNAKKSSTQPAWSPDGHWVAFVSDRDGKRQLYRIAVAGGESEKLTSGDEGVNNFAWSPDGAHIAFTMTDPIAASLKERERRFGDLRIEDEDRRMAHLYVMSLPTTVGSPAPAPRALTK